MAVRGARGAAGQRASSLHSAARQFATSNPPGDFPNGQGKPPAAMAAAPGPKRGRPSDYSFQVAISICARLAEGKSLRAICSEAGMPGRATVFRWIARHKEFRDEYTLACELRAEDLADEMMEVAMTLAFGWKKAGRMAGRLGSWITRTLPAFALG
jgi:hypothetical protein